MPFVMYPCHVQRLAEIQRTGMCKQKGGERCVTFGLEVYFYAVVPSDNTKIEILTAETVAV